MREPQDISTGETWKFINLRMVNPGFRKCESAARYVEYVKTIKYDEIFRVVYKLINSLHGVTVRSLTNCPRYFVNLVGEVKSLYLIPHHHQKTP